MCPVEALFIQIPSCLRMIYAIARLNILEMRSNLIVKTGRSDTTIRHSSFVNHQFGSGSSRLG